MPGRRTVFRFAALLLLSLTSVELLACEVLNPSGCESYGVPGSQQAQDDDNCLCCCFHIVVERPIHLDHQDLLLRGWVEPDTSRPRTQSSCIYHPPRV